MSRSVFVLSLAVLSESAAMSRKIATDFTLIPLRFNAALEVLKKQPSVNPSKIAAVG